MNHKTIDRPFELKTASDDGTFTGYGSVFGEMDSYADIVMPGAFKDSLAADFAAKDRPVPMLWQHQSSNPIGVYTTVKEDATGLYVEGQVNMDVQQGREALSLMKQKALSGLSIGYNTIKSIYNDAGARLLQSVKLWEISPVTFPAGDSARIQSAKSIEGLATLSDIEDHLRDAYGLSRKEAVTLVARIKANVTQSDSASAEAVDVQKALAILRNNQAR